MQEPRGSYYVESGDIMTDQTRRILIDKDLRPAYYDDFHCLAEGCELSCCKGWKIMFSKKDYLSLKRQRGSDALNTRMDGGLRRVKGKMQNESSYGEFDMDSGVCPLLQEDGLCLLQIEKGHGALPRVCRSYPRNRLLTAGYLERSLSPSCEGVLKLLWDHPEGIEFRSDPLAKDQQIWMTLPDDNPLPMFFPVVREWCIDLLQDRRFTLPQRIFLMGMGLKWLAEGETDINRWIERAAVLPESVDAASILPHGDKELAMYLSECIHTITHIYTSNPFFVQIKMNVLASTNAKVNLNEKNFSIPLTPYCEARERFESTWGKYEYFMENLLVSAFFYLTLPILTSKEVLWKSYVNFCNLYALYRFLAVMSCREGAPGDRAELFRLVVFASRSLLHNRGMQAELRDELFKTGSATLAHMAILLCG